jgi:anti-sigma factor RsiW
MTHLGDALSALVDGELDGTELDRANAHLAACAQCRGEATALRLLKTGLRALGAAGECQPFTQSPGVVPVDALTARLLALGPQRCAAAGPRAVVRVRRRARYVVWGALSLVVVGIGSAAFGMGGSGAAGGQMPKVTPQLVEFDLQHAINAGDVPDAVIPTPAELPGKAWSQVSVEATTP